MANRAELEAVIKLREELSGKVAKVDRDLAKLDKSINKVKKSSGGLGEKLTANAKRFLNVSTAAVALAAGVAAATKRYVEFGTQLVDLSSKTGLAIGELQELRFIGEQTGVGFDQLTNAVQRLGRRTAAELPEATKFLSKMGLSIDDILSRSPGEGFALVADKIAQIKSPAEQAAAAMGVFGDAGLQILPAINQGVQDNVDRFRELGVAMSDEAAQSAKQFGDSLTDLKARFEGIQQSIGAVVVPALQNMAAFFTDILPGAFQLAASGFADFIVVLVENTAKAAAALAIFNDSMVGVSDSLFQAALDLRAWSAEQEIAAEKNFVAATSMDRIKEATGEAGEATQQFASNLGSAGLGAVKLGEAAGIILPEQLAVLGESEAEANQALIEHENRMFQVKLRVLELAAAEGKLSKDTVAGMRKVLEEQRKVDEERQASANATNLFIGDSNAALVGDSLAAFGQLGSKFKALSIAQAVIATYASIAKTWAQFGFPLGIPFAAAAAAVGFANVAKIKSADSGFPEGTPNLDFSSFGPEQAINVHGEEAIIPKGGGHQLAGEIAESLPGGGGMPVTINVNMKAGVVSADKGELATAIADAVGVVIKDNLGNAVGNMERRFQGTFAKR